MLLVSLDVGFAGACGALGAIGASRGIGVPAVAVCVSGAMVVCVNGARVVVVGLRSLVLLEAEVLAVVGAVGANIGWCVWRLCGGETDVCCVVMVVVKGVLLPGIGAGVEVVVGRGDTDSGLLFLAKVSLCCIGVPVGTETGATDVVIGSGFV